MKRFTVSAAIFLLAFAFSPVFATTQFDQLKALAGDWVAKLPDGTTMNLTYTSISGGTAVMEVLNLPNGTDMRSIYHQNGDNIMMTHYCESGTQPRLQSNSSTDSTALALSFVDVTNVPVPEKSAYLYKVVFHFKDNDSFSQDVTWMVQGKESTQTWNLQRKK